MRMIGTGKAPQGYLEGQIFDVDDNDHGTVDDLERKGWAKRVAPEDDPGRTVVQIANSIVRGDLLTNPHDRAVADEIGGLNEALPIVHLSDPTATEADYEAESKVGASRDFFGDPHPVAAEKGARAKAKAAADKAADKDSK